MDEYIFVTKDSTDYRREIRVRAETGDMAVKLSKLLMEPDETVIEWGILYNVTGL